MIFLMTSLLLRAGLRGQAIQPVALGSTLEDNPGMRHTFSQS
jgi:hypothetical protein